MKYEQVWEAVDKLARINGLSPSGLAKKAGLDATTFNKSKRIRPDGKRRWPSLDSINKIIEVCNITFDEFYHLVETGTEPKTMNSIPYIKSSKLLASKEIIGSKLNTEKWDKIRFPEPRDNLYAVDMNSDLFEPYYRQGTLLIISQNSEVRCADRVVVYLKNGDMLIKEFVRRTASTIELKEISSDESFSVSLKDLKLINRLVWASQ